MIFKLDRLARTTKQLLHLLEDFEKGKFILSVYKTILIRVHQWGSFSLPLWALLFEMEAALIRERVVLWIGSD